jgi:hypothetical protein
MTSETKKFIIFEILLWILSIKLSVVFIMQKKEKVVALLLEQKTSIHVQVIKNKEVVNIQTNEKKINLKKSEIENTCIEEYIPE